jgi:hypothetical protein
VQFAIVAIDRGNRRDVMASMERLASDVLPNAARRDRTDPTGEQLERLRDRADSSMAAR